jgi:hypothetical protein
MICKQSRTDLDADKICPDCYVHFDIRRCSKCGSKTDSELLEVSPCSEGLFCPECYRSEVIKYQKSICFRCSPTKVDAATGEMCESCDKEGWKSYYDFYSGEINPYLTKDNAA